jgi:copper homeostasis protein
MSHKVQVEICTGDLESALAAEQGGADRVELCDNLSVGGTTPSAGTIAEACRRLAIPVHVLIRPRGGDFVPSPAELAAMRFDIEIARTLGAAGVVFGILRPDATIERDQTASLVALARPMSVTFHKAFDQSSEPENALETLIELGVDRVLTSGGRPSALEGMNTLKRLVEQSRGRISILAGGRLSADNLESIIAATGVREVHLGSAVSRIMPGSMTSTPRDGSEVAWSGVEAGKVRAIVDTLMRLNDSQPSES